MGLKNNIAFVVFEHPKAKYPKLVEVFAFEDDARQHARYLQEAKRRDVYVSPVPVQYGQVL